MSIENQKPCLKTENWFYFFGNQFLNIVFVMVIKEITRKLPNVR